jgi:2-isopropylmalate synthase
LEDKTIRIYDCTLREGSQAPRISFSLHDKLKITTRFDEMGFAYTVGGWPASNVKDLKYFEEIKKVRLQQIKVVAFGRTRNHNVRAENDTNLNSLIKVGTDCAHIFGKGWDFQVLKVLNISFEENLDLIYDSLRYLKKHISEVSFGFEHFFDAYKNNREYSLKVLNAAVSAGADWIDLPDTNGGCFPHEVGKIVSDITGRFNTPFGVHCHDDSGCGVANTIAAVLNGVRIVEGTVNGYSERCGMADLCTVIPNLQLKLGYRCIPEENLKYLTRLSREIAEIVQSEPLTRHPYVGSFAFTHKGGVHVDAFLKAPQTYQHIDPALVGNKSDIAISEVSGRCNIAALLNKYDPRAHFSKRETKDFLRKIKELELAGYDFNIADASLLLLLLKHKKTFKKHIRIKDYSATFTGKSSIGGGCYIEIKADLFVSGKILKNQKIVCKMNRGAHFLPIMNKLLREYCRHFPQLKCLRFNDYSVRAIKSGTHQIKVYLHFSDGEGEWQIMGIGGNFVKAMLEVLSDAVEYILNSKEITRLGKGEL